TNIPEKTEIFVYTLLGQSISINRTEEYGNTKILDISNLDSGAYFLDICESGKTVGRVLFLKE
ncbi:MAG: T9SS type A sorting domain-containing protein, partial [Bacteroidetes bacterium]|nr:T9SS type A sorting domain-containing protein [Bacteroidota bacterium]MBT7143341.1 T9SS type A sorting domain-containing protein [Bacteroidota bacterium]MBT7493179.1 T9SS type A sorting domain-containing protein [Bacteroidota bacterium]